MVSINGTPIKAKYFGDHTLNTLLPDDIVDGDKPIVIGWQYRSDEEMFLVWCLKKELSRRCNNPIYLNMPYIPNARQDRVENGHDIFTLKWFAEWLNALEFDRVCVLDPHSHVSTALINNVFVFGPFVFIEDTIHYILEDTDDHKLVLFYPDEGAMKRYSSASRSLPYCFGVKTRDWVSHEITDYKIEGATDELKDANVLIIDDICGSGSTLKEAAAKLKEQGASKVFAFTTHCENRAVYACLFDSIERLYTTNSVLTENFLKTAAQLGEKDRFNIAKLPYLMGGCDA